MQLLCFEGLQKKPSLEILQHTVLKINDTFINAELTFISALVTGPNLLIIPYSTVGLQTQVHCWRPFTVLTAYLACEGNKIKTYVLTSA